MYTKRFRIGILPPALAVLLLLCLSCARYGNTIEGTGWEILFDQEVSQAAVAAQEGWRSITVPFSMKSPYPPARDFRYLWVRAQLNVDNPARWYGLSMGRIAISDSTYVNGRLAGEHTPKMVCLLPKPRNYPVTGDVFGGGLLRSGVNELYVRIGYYGMEHGGILGPVRLLEEDDFLIDHFKNALIYDQFPFGVMLIFAIIMITMAIVSMVYYRDVLPFVFTLGLFMLIVYNMANFMPFRFVPAEISILIQRLSMPLFFIICIFLIQTIARFYLFKSNIIVVSLFALFAVMSISPGETVFGLDEGRVMQVLSLVTLLAYFVQLLPHIHERHRGTITWYVLLAFSIISVVIGGCEFFFNITGSRYKDLMLTYVIPVVIPMFSMALAREQFKQQMELRLLYDRLKRFEDRDRPLSITETSEEKLKRVIAFIDENYLSAISREGLAAAIEMNHNYMSRLFREYTGMKINDYINKKRIEYATEKLRDRDLRIIDVAHDAGFESLTTFNRIFREVAGKTPSRFRDDISG